MTEQRLWHWLSGLLPKGHYSRIESRETAPGFPDVHYQINALGTRAAGTIELKDSRTPNAEVPFKNAQDGIHDSQMHWIKSNVSNGGIVWIVARVGRKVLWIHGRHVSKFNGSVLKRLESLASLVLSGRRVTTEDTHRILMMMQGRMR